MTDIRQNMSARNAGAGSTGPYFSIRAHATKTLAGLMMATAFLTATGCSAQEAAPLDINAYDLTFADEFDTIDVSRLGPGTRWIAHTPWHGDFGDAKFVDPRDGFPFTVKDGILQIEARKNQDGKWQSGLLSGADTKGKGFSQKYGYFEMRAKLPAGPGVWPAFWLMGVDPLIDKQAKASAEIDIVEFYGHAPASYMSAVHVWPKDKSIEKSSQYQKVTVEPNALSNDYHLYGASIDAEKIRIYLDRKEVWVLDTPPTHRQPMYMLINLALGSGWPIENTPNPSVMLVDYVRAYAKKPTSQ